MKLYATITSERATKGQGGSELKIVIYSEDRIPVYEIKATPNIFEVKYAPETYLDNDYLLRLLGDLKGKHKAKRQKGEQICELCNRIMVHYVEPKPNKKVYYCDNCET